MKYSPTKERVLIHGSLRLVCAFYWYTWLIKFVNYLTISFHVCVVSWSAIRASKVCPGNPEQEWLVVPGIVSNLLGSARLLLLVLLVVLLPTVLVPIVPSWAVGPWQGELEEVAFLGLVHVLIHAVVMLHVFMIMVHVMAHFMRMVHMLMIHVVLMVHVLVMTVVMVHVVVHAMIMVVVHVLMVHVSMMMMTMISMSVVVSMVMVVVPAGQSGISRQKISEAHL